MNILTLDLGASTGWALSTGSSVVSGTQKFEAGRHLGAGMQLIRFKGWLDEIHKSTPLDQLYYEEVRAHAGNLAAHSYGAFWGILTSWCQERGVPFEGVPVGTIKKRAGKGNLNKEQMIAAARHKGWNPMSSDEADALWLLDYVLGGLT